MSPTDTTTTTAEMSLEELLQAGRQTAEKALAEQRQREKEQERREEERRQASWAEFRRRVNEFLPPALHEYASWEVPCRVASNYENVNLDVPGCSPIWFNFYNADNRSLWSPKIHVQGFTLYEPDDFDRGHFGHTAAVQPERTVETGDLVYALGLAPKVEDKRQRLQAEADRLNRAWEEQEARCKAEAAEREREEQAAARETRQEAEFLGVELHTATPGERLAEVIREIVADTLGRYTIGADYEEPELELFAGEKPAPF